MSGSSSWLGRASGALGALLAIAIVARVVWELLEPLLPLLGGLLVVSSGCWRPRSTGAGTGSRV